MKQLILYDMENTAIVNIVFDENNDFTTYELDMPCPCNLKTIVIKTPKKEEEKENE